MGINNRCNPWNVCNRFEFDRIKSWHRLYVSYNLWSWVTWIWPSYFVCLGSKWWSELNYKFQYWIYNNSLTICNWFGVNWTRSGRGGGNYVSGRSVVTPANILQNWHYFCFRSDFSYWKSIREAFFPSWIIRATIIITTPSPPTTCARYSDNGVNSRQGYSRQRVFFFILFRFLLVSGGGGDTYAVYTWRSRAAGRRRFPHRKE